MTTAAVLAHQGGWDEAVLVVLPLVLLAGLLRLARHRALKEAAHDDDHLADAAAPRPPDPGTAPER